MASYKNELSNLSYTNKDFSTIYPELLDIVKKLSYKWDPTISDESDPGVVLLKLNALMTDKLNYNIDKNILELFPSSVTQYQNAREIFDQCGYTMRYYNSATTFVSFALTSFPTKEDFNGTESDLKDDDKLIVIPRFTMLCTPDNKLVYTTTDDVKLYQQSGDQTVLAIEGRVQDYTINGSNLITANMLDTKNRLYLSGTDIAENGIFITNADKDNYNDWYAVDNLVLQDLGERCYKFGVTRDGTRCYIEFPTDINDIIGGGLNIKYIRTRGKNGHISSKNLTNFYTDTTAEQRSLSGQPVDAQEFTITTNHVMFTNPLPSAEGRDPETIEEANKNYQKVKTTFDTLVSLRDYTNYIYSSKMASNGFVCDRLTDPQASYKINSLENGAETILTKVKRDEPVNLYEKDEDSDEYTKLEAADITEYYTYDDETGVYSSIKEKDQLDAFDLRIYAFNYVPNVTDDALFEKTFEIMPQLESRAGAYGLQEQWDTLTDNKCIQHNFKAPKVNTPFIFKNKYPISATIIPTQKLDTLGKTEVRNNVKLALFALLNSRACEWGAEPDYALIYDTILTADSRIRGVLLEKFSYETWAVYLTSDGKGFAEVRIDNDIKGHPVVSPLPDTAEETVFNNIRQEITNRSYLAGVTPLYEKVSSFDYNVLQSAEQEITNIAEFKTNTVIPSTSVVSDNKTVNFNVRQNEQVTFTAPSLIKDREYTNYVKYICNFSSGSNELHELQGDDYIYFFWKTDDNENTGYTYNLYTNDTEKNGVTVNYIQSDKSIISYTNETDTDLKDTLDSIVSYIKSNCTRNSGTILDERTNNNISKLISSNYVIEPPQVIKSMKINQVTLGTTDTQYMVWFVNNEDGTLFDDDVQEYVLGPNEYILYTNAQKTTLHAVGEGTKLSRTTKFKISSKFGLTIEDIETFGLSAITNDHWYRVPTDQPIRLIEQEFVSMGEGTEITIQLDEVSDESIYTLKFDGLYKDEEPEPIPIDLAGAEISYKVSDSDSDSLLTERPTSIKWTVSAALNIVIDDIKRTQELAFGQTITAGIKTKKDDEDDEEIEYTNIEGVKDVTKIVQYSHNVNYAQKDADTQSVKDHFNTDKLSVYVYNAITTSDVLDENNYLIALDNEPGIKRTTTITFKLPSGHYILPIKVTNTNLISCTIEQSDTQLTNLTNLLSQSTTSSADATPYKYGNHWYILESDGVKDIKLTFTVNLSDEKYKEDKRLLQILPLVRVTSTTVGSTGAITDLRTTCYNLAKEYDPQLEFNYTAEFDAETQISDPLYSYSFFNPHHVMNSYTIGQAYFTRDESGSTKELVTIDDRVR